VFSLLAKNDLKKKVVYRSGFIRNTTGALSCSNCHRTVDRDVNAAQNIYRLGVDYLKNTPRPSELERKVKKALQTSQRNVKRLCRTMQYDTGTELF